MEDIVTYTCLLRAIHFGNAKGHHFRCGGEVRLARDNGLVCAACEAKGWPVPLTDPQGRLIIINGVINICFEER